MKECFAKLVVTEELGRNWAPNCGGNPAWLPILRAAIPAWRDPYNIPFGSGMAGLGI